MLSGEEIKFICQYCGFENVTWVGLIQSGKHEFVEDCYVCRNTNRIIITIDQLGNVHVESRLVNW